MKFGMKPIAFLSVLIVSSVSLAAESLTVYFGTGGGDSKGIYRAEFDPDKGKLSTPVLAAEIRSPGFLAMHPDGKHLYAVAGVEGGPGVAAFAIEQGGHLKKLTSATIGDGGGTHVAVHPSGKFLLTAQYGGGSVAVFPVDADGQVQGIAQLIDHEGGSKVVKGRQDSPHPHWCGFSPDGRFAFVPDLGMDGVNIYRVDPEKPALEKHGFAESVPGGGPRHMRFSVDGKYIYLLNELALSVTTFAYDSENGTTKQLTTTPALPDGVKEKESFNSSSEILVHPSGKFVYSANRGHDSITAYQASATGELTVTEVESIRGSWPRNINLDPSGQWLLAAGAHSNTISVFKIDQENGELQFQTRGIASVPGPICILFDF